MAATKPELRSFAKRQKYTCAVSETFSTKTARIMHFCWFLLFPKHVNPKLVAAGLPKLPYTDYIRLKQD